jgi:hypothetical protein
MCKYTTFISFNPAMEEITSKKSLVNVLGVVYVHTKTSDGGDLYLTRFAAPYHEHFETKNWYESDWFNEKKIRLIGTSSVRYRAKALTW